MIYAKITYMMLFFMIKICLWKPVFNTHAWLIQVWEDETTPWHIDLINFRPPNPHNNQPNKSTSISPKSTSITGFTHWLSSITIQPTHYFLRDLIFVYSIELETANSTVNNILFNNTMSLEEKGSEETHVKFHSSKRMVVANKS